MFLERQLLAESHAGIVYPSRVATYGPLNPFVFDEISLKQERILSIRAAPARPAEESALDLAALQALAQSSRHSHDLLECFIWPSQGCTPHIMSILRGSTTGTLASNATCLIGPFALD